VAKFVFRLEALLKQRRREQRHKQLGVAEVEQERLGLEVELRRQQVQLEACRGEVRSLLHTVDGGSVVVEADQLRRGAAVAVAADRAARTLAIQLAGVHRRLSRAREELRLADIRLKAVEQLKQTQSERFLAKQKKREADEMDELAVMRAGRTNGTML
jgi:flagellar export protein FliJ